MNMSDRLTHTHAQHAQLQQQLADLEQQRATYLRTWTAHYQQIEQQLWAAQGQVVLLEELAKAEAGVCAPPPSSS